MDLGSFGLCICRDLGPRHLCIFSFLLPYEQVKKTVIARLLYPVCSLLSKAHPFQHLLNESVKTYLHISCHYNEGKQLFVTFWLLLLKNKPFSICSTEKCVCKSNVQVCVCLCVYVCGIFEIQRTDLSRFIRGLLFGQFARMKGPFDMASHLDVLTSILVSGSFAKFLVFFISLDTAVRSIIFY